jgi:hypothetical protein
VNVLSEVFELLDGRFVADVEELIARKLMEDPVDLPLEVFLFQMLKGVLGK